MNSRHTDEMIYKLESAGLGYHVKTEELDDRLGMSRKTSQLSNLEKFLEKLL